MESSQEKSLERETGFEPATSTLARSHSTTELLPLVVSFYCTCAFATKSLHPHWHPLVVTLFFLDHLHFFRNPRWRPQLSARQQIALDLFRDPGDLLLGRWGRRWGRRGD